MSTEIKVNYTEVYRVVTQLKASVEAEIDAIEQEYDQIILSLDDLDSATNAIFQVTLLRNQKKALASVQILEKMLSFIQNSTQQIEFRDKYIARFFSPLSGANE